MVTFYRNNSYTKFESCRFSWAAILCILSIHILLCSARSIQDEPNTGYESTTDTEAEVVKALSELSPETRKNIEDFIQEQENRKDGNVGGMETDNVDDIAEGNEDEEGNDYYDERDEQKNFTELKTTTLPTKPTRRTRPHRDYDEDEDPIEDEENPDDDLMPIESTSTTTTEEPITRVPIKKYNEEEDYDIHETTESSESDLTVTIIRPTNTSILVTSNGLTQKNYSFGIFVPVLLCICISVS